MAGPDTTYDRRRGLGMDRTALGRDMAAVTDRDEEAPGTPGVGVPLRIAAPIPTSGLFGIRGANIVHAAHEAIVITDDERRVVALNPAAQRLLLCSSEEALGRPLDRFVPLRDRGAHGELMRRFIAGGGQESRMAAMRKVTALRTDGREIPVEVMLSTVDLVDSSGPRRYFAALMRDLSEVQALATELDNLQRRQRAVFELSPVAIWIADGGHVVYANAAAARLFEVGDGRELSGRSIYEMVNAASHDTLRQQVDRVLGGEIAPARFEGSLVGAKGELREVEIALAALPDHGRTTVQMVVSDLTQNRRTALEVERSRQMLRQLSANAVEAREADRRRIARELHDELGQRLTALKMDVATLADSTDPAARQARVDEMLSLIDETVAALRRISADLRPLMLDDLGLSAAIEWLAKDASRRLGIAIEVQVIELDPAPDGQLAIAIYRMVQEALTNVSRHARASRVRVVLNASDADLVLSVHDNGIGFPARALQRQGSFGLLGMRERAIMFGGSLAIDNPPGGGGRLTVRVPLGRPAGAADPARTR